MLPSPPGPHSFHAPTLLSAFLNSLTLGLERQRLHLLEEQPLSAAGGQIVEREGGLRSKRERRKKRGPPPLMEREREPMSLSLSEVSSFHSLRSGQRSSLVVLTKILNETLL